MINKGNKSYEIYEIISNKRVYTIEIDKDENFIEFWLYQGSMGIKIFMFGIDTTDDYLDILIANVDEYIEDYEKEYCNE